MQGLMPGDLGNLGSATLDSKYVCFLLEKLLAMQSKEHGIGETISEYGKAHLELTVRLLACAQRMHVARAEWMTMEDPLQELSNQFAEGYPSIDDYNRLRINNDEDDSDVYSLKSVPVKASSLAESPFVHFVLRHLFAGALGPSAAADFSEGIASRRQRLFRLSDNQSSPVFEPSDNPLFEAVALSCEGLSSAKPSGVIGMLHVVSAACEMFPLGGCWASSTNAWLKISKDATIAEQLCISCGSCMDLVAVRPVEE